MTCSEKNGVGWDFNKHEFKPFRDPTCEPGLVSILFLACGRPKLTRTTLESTFEALSSYEGEIEWNLLEQGECEENVTYLRSLDLPRKNLILSKNYGINNGLNRLWGVSHGEYGMVLENDWLNTKPHFNFLQKAKDILDQYQDIGIIRLRNPWDKNEQWGFGKPEYEPLTCSNEQLKKANISLEERMGISGPFFVSDLPNGFNNNPILIRKSLYQRIGPMNEVPFWTDPRHDETHFQIKVALTKSLIAFLNPGPYEHIGGGLKSKYE